MKIRYRKVPDLLNADGYSWFPFLQVCLRYGTKGKMFLALVDSGAMDCIFPASMGTLLGIDVPSGRPKTYFGLAGQSASGYMHTIDLQVTGFNNWHSMEVGFIDAEIVPLLGQNGFFQNYQIVFEKFRLQFEVNTRMDALMRGRKRGT